MDEIDTRDSAPFDRVVRFSAVEMAEGTGSQLAAPARGSEPSPEWLAKLADLGVAGSQLVLKPERDGRSRAGLPPPRRQTATGMDAVPPPPMRRPKGTDAEALVPTTTPPIATAPSPAAYVRAPYRPPGYVPTPVDRGEPTVAPRFIETDRVIPLAADDVMPMTSYFKRLMPPVSKRTAAMIGAGIAVSAIAFLALHSDAPHATQAAAIASAPTAPIAASTPAVATPAVAAPAAIAAPAAPGLVRVQVLSKPDGATVTLLDGVNAQVVGRTPIEISVDPSRGYDLVLALAQQPTRVAHLDPTSTAPLMIDFAAAPVPAIAAARSAPVAAPVSAPRPVAAAITTSVASRAPATAPAGSGLLMISTKPPCEIVIDGKSTHLMTPQRAVPVSLGHHQIALINAQQKIRRSLDVQIETGHPTKVIRDFTK